MPDRAIYHRKPHVMVNYKMVGNEILNPGAPFEDVGDFQEFKQFEEYDWNLRPIVTQTRPLLPIVWTVEALSLVSAVTLNPTPQPGLNADNNGTIYWLPQSYFGRGRTIHYTPKTVLTFVSAGNAEDTDDEEMKEYFAQTLLDISSFLEEHHISIFGVVPGNIFLNPNFSPITAGLPYERAELVEEFFDGSITTFYGVNMPKDGIEKWYGGETLFLLPITGPDYVTTYHEPGSEIYDFDTTHIPYAYDQNRFQGTIDLFGRMSRQIHSFYAPGLEENEDFPLATYLSFWNSTYNLMMPNFLHQNVVLDSKANRENFYGAVLTTKIVEFYDPST